MWVEQAFAAVTKIVAVAAAVSAATSEENGRFRSEKVRVRLWFGA